MDLRLKSDIAIVTGGASGIGEATVRALVDEGVRVAIFDLDGAGADRCASEFSATGAEVLAIQTDVTNEASLTAAVGRIVSKWGGIDHVVCCAGVSKLYGKTVEEVTVPEWDEMMTVNVRGQWLPVKASLPYLRASGSPTIAMVASDSALVAAPGDAAYCTSKGAVMMFVKALSVDLQGTGIRVNSVCPSIVDTPMSRRALGRDDSGFAGESFPVQLPEDVARYLVLLSSPVTSTINGHALVSDFGYTAMSSFPA